jgi:hypothetical protein
MSFRKKRIIIAIGLILLIVASILTWRFFFNRPDKVNYLIQGVPYHGIYNLFFRGADSTAISSIISVLGYWGDTRFTLNEIKMKFPPGEQVKSEGLENFFKESGYETYRWSSSEADGEIDIIKRYINSQKKVPVIVLQRRSLNETFVNSGFRVVIGILEKDKKIIVHDHDFGNNYEILFHDFEEMSAPNARAILAAWPSEKIKNQIKGPDYSAPYPERLEAMDELGEAMVTKAVSAIDNYRKGEMEDALKLYSEFIGDSSFVQFPLAFKLWWLSVFAGINVEANKPEEAIKIITEQVLPFNKRINEAPAGWFVPPEDRLFYPYIILSKAYLKKDQKDMAVSNYNEAREIAESSALAKQEIDRWFSQLEESLGI